MRDPEIWSIGLGRWWNVQVRVHLFFLLVAVFTLYLISTQPGDHGWFALGCIAALFFSVLLHEIAHVFVARRLGGMGNEIVVGPLGGLNSVHVPYEPQSELLALLAGPLINAGLCLLAAACLLLAGDKSVIGLMNPLDRNLMIADSRVWVVALKLVFCINWLLVVFNLIPAHPFDCGRAIRVLLAFFWPELRLQQSLAIGARLAKVTAACLLLAAWLTADMFPDYIVPLWFVLSMLSIFVYFNARREDFRSTETESNDEPVFGYDFSQGYTSLERSLSSREDGPHTASVDETGLSRWWARRREAREMQRRQQEAEDEKHVDEILSRLHEHGMQSLSREDRELLQRVSQRYRSRLS